MISHIFAAVKQTLEVALRAAGEELPRHELGAWKLPTLSAPNQIVWAVVGGPIAGARQGQAKLGVREIAVRNERVQVHIWGRGGFDETERLVNHFLAACRAVLTSFSFAPVSTDWTIGQEAVTVTGRLCVVTIDVHVPVTQEPIGISQPPHTVTIVPQVNH